MGESPSAGRPRRFTIWTVVAPLALLGSVSVLVLIAQGAGWVGSDARSDTPPHKHTPNVAKKRHTTKVHRVSLPPVRLSYRVAPGDTFGSIAVRFRTTIAQLEALNPGVDSSHLTIGQALRIR
jgi:LysM repeat protein